MEGPKLSFGFSKQKRVLKNVTTKLSDGPLEYRKPMREYVTSIEGDVINTDKPLAERLVIPVPRSRSSIAYRIRQQLIQVDPTDELTTKAVEEIKQELLESSDSFGSSVNGLHQRVIPAPQNPESADTPIEDANYEVVPVEEFGIAALTGMGLDRDELKNLKSVALGPIRPKGLGLGADPRAVQSAVSDLKNVDSQKLKWRTGARCQVILGKHSNCYGLINGMDGDTGRVYVNLTLSQQVVSILQPMLRLVTEKEYSTYAHCLNQADVNKYKAEETESNGRRMTGGDATQVVQTKRITNWVRPKLKVQLRDPRFKNGPHYKSKVAVTSIDPQSGHCTCMTLSGEHIENIPQRYLQTVVPHVSNSPVMIVGGTRTGEMGRLIKRHRSSNEVDIRTRAGTMIVLTYDDVCAVAD